MPFITRPTITETFLARVRSTPDRVGFQFKVEPGGARSADKDAESREWECLTFREFHDRCRLLSFGLIGLGIGKKDKVALLSRTRIEWSLADMAVLGAGAITVPIQPAATASELVRVLKHSEARVLLLEDAAQLAKIVEAREREPGCLPGLEKIVVIDPQAMRLAVNPGRNMREALTLQALAELGKREERKAPRLFEENLAGARPEDVFTLCYTTGTTGEPKGVPLTHENLMSVIEDCLERMSGRIRADRETLLALLPFSHVLGRLESMIFYALGGKLAFCARPNRGDHGDRIRESLLEVRPTLIFAVPRVFEKAYHQIQSAAESERTLTLALFNRALRVGRLYHEAFRGKRSPSAQLAARYALAKALVFRRITERFGGRLRYAICGGAPLSQELGEFFEIVGIRILEGYGLTETCAPVTLADPDHPRFGTVGKPLADVSLKIADDGEILVRSKKVFHGYYKDESGTAAAFENGWFRTGDVGYLDHEGYLHVTDRKKDLIVTSGGKNIAPQKVESLAKTHPLIREIVVYGDRKDYVTALITLDRDAVIAYANEHQILFSDYVGLIKNPKILAWVEKDLDEVNHQLAGHERIRKFMILPGDFTVEGGELSSSLKVRRDAIHRRYREEIESLYR